MRILTVAPEKYERYCDFLRQMRRLRATVFGGRLAWDVSVTAGEERDQYDDCRPTFLLAIADGGKVAGCVRLLPASGTTMLEQTFPQLLDAGSLLIRGWSRVHASASILRPDRIIVGEVRDGVALTLLKAWNTGHPGGVTTIHSNTAMSALRRLEQLTAEASQQPMQKVIGEAVDLVVSIERTGKGRRVREVIHIEGYRNGRYQTEHYAQIDEDRHVA